MFELFSTGRFMPHAHCYAMDQLLIGANFCTDLLIGLSYVTISFILLYLVRTIRLPFHWVFIAFGTFIAACGSTHFMEVWTLYVPVYWLSTSVKGVTALASVATAVCLPFVVPSVTRLVESARLSEQRQQELETAHRELEIQLARTREASEAKNRFFAAISHELRTPLNSIIGFSDVMLERYRGGELSDAHHERSLEYINTAGVHLLKLINDLLDMSRLEAGRFQLDKKPINVDEAIDEVLSIVRPMANAKQLTLESPHQKIGDVEADPARLRQILFNLLSNAMKFTPPGGRVWITIDPEPRSITVHDTGIGIAPGDQARVFESFEQIMNPLRSSDRGAGLGLAITRQLVESHGWKLQLESAEGQGSHFTILLASEFS